MIRVLVLPQVAGLMRKKRIRETALCHVAREVAAGTPGAGETDLGKGLFKKHAARPGSGKSGGYRVIIAYHPPKTDRVLAAYAFAKNAASTLTPDGHEALASAAAAFLAANDQQVASLLASGDVQEPRCNEH